MRFTTRWTVYQVWRLGASPQNPPNRHKSTRWPWDDPEVAQELADSFADLNWTKILDRLPRRVNPLMKERWFRGLCYYWVVDRAEYATDLIFTGREALAGLYPRLLDHAAVNFSAKDILCFLGRRFHPRFDGEVLTDCQKGCGPVRGSSIG